MRTTSSSIEKYMPYGNLLVMARLIPDRSTAYFSGSSRIRRWVALISLRNSKPKPGCSDSYHSKAASMSASLAAFERIR